VFLYLQAHAVGMGLTTENVGSFTFCPPHSFFYLQKLIIKQGGKNCEVPHYAMFSIPYFLSSDQISPQWHAISFVLSV
jgi:hypothetical protein